MDKIKVTVINKQKVVKIPSGTRMLIRRCCNAVVKQQNIEYGTEVSIQFVDNATIKEYNAKYRDIDKVTDVLSFPMGENEEFDINPETGLKILGDIVVSLERAHKQSKEYGHSFQRELIYLVCHSMLHLLGFDHMKPGLQREQMRENEEEIMAMLGLSRTGTYDYQ